MTSIDAHEIHYQRGLEYHRLNLPSEAVTEYSACLRIAPKFGPALYCRGRALFLLQKFDDAEQDANRLFESDQKTSAAFLLRGLCFEQNNKFQCALNDYVEAVNLDPKNHEALENIGLILMKANRNSEAIEYFEKALNLGSKSKYLSANILKLKMRIAEWSSAELIKNKIFESMSAGNCVCPPFMAIIFGANASEQLLCAHEYSDYLGISRIKRRSWKVAQNKRIRVGYLSNELRNHATAALLTEVLENHNTSQFDIFAFSWGYQPDDVMSRRIKKAIPQYFDISSMTDAEAVDFVRSYKLDIAIDLKGHTRDQRMSLFAHGLAPIQINYLGFPGTVGNASSDYIIADPIVASEEVKTNILEKIICMPHCYQPNDTQRRISEFPISRQDENLPETGTIFCCFNQIQKISPKIFSVWMRILSRVPMSVLWLLTNQKEAIRNLRKEAEIRGIHPNRLFFAQPLPLDKHLRRFGLADLFLDTMYYNAHTTASDAIWAGVPVLTVEGTTFAGRVATSLLITCGLRELIAQSLDEYEAMAVAIGKDPMRIAALKDKIQKISLLSPLFNSLEYTRAYEKGLMEAYKKNLAGEPPSDIYL